MNTRQLRDYVIGLLGMLRIAQDIPDTVKHHKPHRERPHFSRRERKRRQHIHWMSCRKRR